MFTAASSAVAKLQKQPKCEPLPLSEEASTSRGNSGARIDKRGISVRSLGIYKGVQDGWNKKVEGEVRGDETGGAVLPCWDGKGFAFYLGSNKGC